jgi:nucleoside-diphosphate-sugar epimerase
VTAAEIDSSTERGSGSVVYVGEDEFFGPHLTRVLRTNGYDVVSFTSAEHASKTLLGTGNPSPSETARRIVVAFQLAASEVRMLIRQCANAIDHLILISSYKVYPASFRPGPWHADEFNSVADGTAMDEDSEAGRARAAERELWLEGRHLRARTVLRPALIEGIGNPLGYSAWFVNRVLDGEPIILPDHKTTIYRYVAVEDLARAVLAVIGKPAAFGATLNVVGHGMLTYRGHARILARALKRSTAFRYVPVSAWRAAGLPMPVAEDLSASFIASSPVLSALGWEASDDVQFFQQLASALEEFPQSTGRETRALEQRLLSENEHAAEITLQHNAGVARTSVNRQWALMARPGDPNSLMLRHFDSIQKLRPPVLKLRRLAFGELEAGILRGELATAAVPRVLGHNALLEVMHSDSASIPRASKVIVLPSTPCGDQACSHCAGTEAQTLGIDCGGCAWGFTSFPPQHLIPIGLDSENVALLASPLAALIQARQGILIENARTIWICGDTVEAALLAWMVEDSGLQAVLLDRHAKAHPEFPLLDLKECVEKVKDGRRPAPDMVVDFTGSFEITTVITPALTQAKGWWGARKPARLPPELPFHRLPLVASSRRAIVEALEMLKSWSHWRDVGRLVGPAIRLEAYWDALMPPPFAQSYIEIGD